MSHVKDYNRHGLRVTGVKEYHDKHKEICVCHRGCQRFKPWNTDEHCEIAAMTYQMSKLVGIVLVMECKLYIGKGE